MTDLLQWLLHTGQHGDWSEAISDFFLTMGTVLLIPTVSFCGIALLSRNDETGQPWTYHAYNATFFGLIALGSLIPGWIGVILFVLGVVLTAHAIHQEKREVTP